MSKTKKVPTLPAISSGFALLDIEKGRAAMERIVTAGYRIRVTITGYIQNGASGVGRDDGTSREFSIDVDTVVMEEPEFVPADTLGRAWAHSDDLKAGDMITLDGGFDCLSEAEQAKPRKVQENADGELYFMCGTGKRKSRHYLDGQLGEHGEFVGVYKVGK